MSQRLRITALTLATVLAATASQADDNSMAAEVNFTSLGYISATSVLCYDLGYAMVNRGVYAYVTEPNFVKSLMGLQVDWFNAGVANAHRNAEIMGLEESCRQAALSNIVALR